MAAQRRREYLGALNPEVDATILDAGNGGLGNATQLGELSLAESLKLANDASGLTRGDFYSFLGWAEVTHIRISHSREV